MIYSIFLPYYLIQLVDNKVIRLMNIYHSFFYKGEKNRIRFFWNCQNFSSARKDAATRIKWDKKLTTVGCHFEKNWRYLFWIQRQKDSIKGNKKKLNPRVSASSASSASSAFLFLLQIGTQITRMLS